MDTIRLPAELHRLDEFRAHVLARAQAHQAPPALTGKLELVLEELLVNVISYAYDGGEGDVEVTFARDEANALVLTIRDWGAAFDPLAEREGPDLDADVDERAIGGLGIFFVKEMTDGLDYERADEANVLTVRFNT